MPTPTERHLQVIEEKIETIQNIQAEVGLCKPSRRQRKLAITCLEAIGASMCHVPVDFREKHNEISWSAIDCWGTQGTFTPNNFRKNQLDRCEQFFSRQKSEISRHSGGETKIQKGIINNLLAEYEDVSKSWHEQIFLPYVLISITSILVAVRVGLIRTEINLTISQSVSYLVHRAITLIIAVYTQTRSREIEFEDEPENWYHTYTEFYERAHAKWSIRKSALSSSLKKHELIRAIITLLWLYSLAFAIFTTILDPN